MASNPIKTAPVATAGVGEAVVGVVLSLLVSHHVIPSGLADTYGPLAIVVLVALFGAVKWHNVTPVVKVQALAGKLAAEIADAQTSPAVQAVEQAVAKAVDDIGKMPSAQAGAPAQPAPEPTPLVQGTMAPPQTPPAAPEQPQAAPEPAAAPVAPEQPAQPTTPVTPA